MKDDAIKVLVAKQTIVGALLNSDWDVVEKYVQTTTVLEIRGALTNISKRLTTEIEKLELSENIDIETTVKEIVFDHLCKGYVVHNVDSAEDLTLKHDIYKDLGADSFDCVELFMSIEEVFGLDVLSKDVETISTINDIVQYVRGCKNG